VRDDVTWVKCNFCGIRCKEQRSYSEEQNSHLR
jgi:hypothetical protein